MAPTTTDLVLAPDAAIDLQTNTILSDGVWTPTQLIDYFVREGFALAAITDHERVDAADELQRIAAERRFPLLVAAEVSAAWRGEPTDTLCFGFDPANPALLTVTQDIMRRQCENTRKVWEHVRAQGHPMPAASELERLLAKPSAQQPKDLFAALVGVMQGDKLAADEAMTAGGFALETADIGVIVDAVHQSGGVCLIAHPGRGGGYVRFDDHLLDELRSEAPIDGFEAYYPAHSAEQVAMYAAYAQTHHLLTSAGSDSHTPENPPIKYAAALSRSLLERLGVRVR